MVGNSALQPSDVKNFLMMPTQRFWLETVSLLDAIALKGNNENTRCWEKISCYITKDAIYLIFLSTLTMLRWTTLGPALYDRVQKVYVLLGVNEKGKKKGRDQL